MLEKPWAFANGAFRHDACARSLRVVGVFYDDRDAGVENGFERLVVEYGEAGIGKLAHLAVGDFVDGDGVFHQRWIGDEDGVDIGEVLVYLGVNGGGENSSGNIGAAAREGYDFAGGGIAEETGKDRDARAILYFAQFAKGLLQHAGVARLV